MGETKYAFRIDDNVKDTFILNRGDGTKKICLLADDNGIFTTMECEVEELRTENPNKRWRAEAGGSYYYLNACGVVVREYDTGDYMSNQLYLVGNYFKTEADVEFHKESLIVYNELKAFAEPEDEQVWDGYTAHYYLYCDITEKAEPIKICKAFYHKDTDLCFASGELASKALETVGEGRVKKYYLRMKEG